MKNNNENEGDKKQKMYESNFVNTGVIGVTHPGLRSAVVPGPLKTVAYKRRRISLTVNGEPYELDVAPSHTLAYTIRETLGLTGTKIACDRGGCGACTVLIDGKPVLSCITLTVECDGKSIMTIEGLEDPKTGKLHPLQQAFINNTAFQCGFCTPGMIVSAKALLDKNPSPTEQDIKEALAGNYCRCGSHYLVIRAVMEASEKRIDING